MYKDLTNIVVHRVHVFKMAAVRHLGFVFQNLVLEIGWLSG